MNNYKNLIKNYLHLYFNLLNYVYKEAKIVLF